MLAEKALVTQQVSGPGTGIEDLVEENRELKERLQHSEQSVAQFIKEMGSLLDKNEPAAMLAENASPKHPTKKRGKVKNRHTLITGDRNDKKPKPYFNQFD